LRGTTYAKADRRTVIQSRCRAWTDNGISPEKGILLNIELAKRAAGVKQEVPVSRVVDWSITEAELRSGNSK
jgi:hypothetical protein